VTYYQRPADSPPSSWYDPDPRHCPACTGCLAPQGHCEGEVCSPMGVATRPDDFCLCKCERCWHSEDPICMERNEHVFCRKHRLFGDL
jgi:hypothetical protein